ncbi:MAG: glycoside hydrolase family 5 protein [Bacteroidetes bacterium]|nr:glycoside hydrolase family 5 protein [Bacteroidota bacterium]
MRIRILGVIFLVFLFSGHINAQKKEVKTKRNVSGADWSTSMNPYRPGIFSNPKKLPLIKVQGNSFVTKNGDTVIFRGVAIADPDKLEQEGQWQKKLFQSVKTFGANIVRIPVHPLAWRMRTPLEYLKLLHQAVEWCTELDLYIIIDWHSIGNLGMELFQDPMYNTTKRETYEFWQIIALTFQGHNTVAFYELFNEPTTYEGKLGRISWTEWKEINENIIHLIRAYDTETIILVAGFDWAFDLTPIRIEPIEGEGIGYTTHPYPHKRKPPYEPKWDEAFGFAKGLYPVFATEFGFIYGDTELHAADNYCERIIAYFDTTAISWAAWIFDPHWFPRLIESWETMKLTPEGEFISAVLRARNKQEKP